MGVYVYLTFDLLGGCRHARFAKKIVSVAAAVDAFLSDPWSMQSTHATRPSTEPQCLHTPGALV
jgi:hypothetical protein